jgi:hypothetical protein
MTRRRTALAVMLLLALVPVHAAAHHGWERVRLVEAPEPREGTIRDAGYEHPHGYVKLETLERTWLVVLAPPSRMENRGLPREMLKPGTKATVMAYPKRDDPMEVRAERITIEGKTTELR